jgi:hypothetical protein
VALIQHTCRMDWLCDVSSCRCLVSTILRHFGMPFELKVEGFSLVISVILYFAFRMRRPQLSHLQSVYGDELLECYSVCSSMGLVAPGITRTPCSTWEVTT